MNALLPQQKPHVADTRNTRNPRRCCLVATLRPNAPRAYTRARARHRLPSRAKPIFSSVHRRLPATPLQPLPGKAFSCCGYPQRTQHTPQRATQRKTATRANTQEPTMPKQNPAARWNRTQLAEKLHALGKDLRALAADIKRPQANAAAISSWHREVASYVHDMSALLAGEMPHSDRVMHKAEELRGASDILVQWADSPTDDTGNKARAAQLTGIAEAIDAFADKLL